MVHVCAVANYFQPLANCFFLNALYIWQYLQNTYNEAVIF